MENKIGNILAVCANGDSSENLRETKIIVQILLENKLIPDILYYYISINPETPETPEKVLYDKHISGKFGDKKLTEKYNIIIFQNCVSCYNTSNPILSKILKSRKGTGGRYISPFEYENIDDIIHNSLLKHGLFVNLKDCYYSGTLSEPINNKNKILQKFQYINLPNKEYKYDIWKSN